MHRLVTLHLRLSRSSTNPVRSLLFLIMCQVKVDLMVLNNVFKLILAYYIVEDVISMQVSVEHCCIRLSTQLLSVYTCMINLCK